MADLLTIATAATRTFQRALDVTSNNVANVSTEGYNRQRVEIRSNNPQIVGPSFNGGGSRIETIERVYADYLWRQKLQATSLNERYGAALENAKSVEGIIAANDGGVQDFLQRFFDSLQNLANEPLSTVNRNMLLDEATNLESHIQNITAFLNDHQTQANAQISSLVDTVNQQLEVIQQANEIIFRARTEGTFPPNDLLDKRDQAIMKLGELIDVRTFEQPNGMVDVYIGNGKLPLLSDNTRVPFTAELGPYTQEGRMEVYLEIGGQKRVVSDLITGGKLGGVLDYRRNMLDQAQRELGLTLNGLVNAFNLQHRQGWDLNGNAGGDFFQPLSTEAVAKNDNVEIDGSLITATFATPANTTLPDGLFDEIADYQPRDYRLEYDGSVFQVYDRVTGQPVTDSSNTPITIAPGSSATVDGLQISVAAGGYAQGDEFILQPHQNMLENFKHIITDPDTIATRGLLEHALPLNSNTGSETGENLTISRAVLNPSNPTPDYVLTYDAAGNQFNVTRGGTPVGTVAVGGSATIEGWTMDASSIDPTQLANGDQFVFKVQESGDNTNAANLANLSLKKLLYRGANNTPSSTILEGYSRMASNVGLYTYGTQINLDAQKNVLNEVNKRVESLSGVNLDEEAANMMRYQQAYQASAQMIQVSNTLFETLIGVIR